jgi:hypothetical protein
MRILAWFLTCLVFLFCALLVTKDDLAKWLIINRVKFITGHQVSLDKASVHFTKSVLYVKNLQLKNPPPYDEVIAAEVPFFAIRIDLQDFFNRRVHLNNLTIDMAQLIIERREDGAVNLHTIRDIRNSRRAQILAAGGKSFITSFQIDVLELKIDRVVFRDHKQGSTFTKIYPINLHESYKDITETESLIRLIVFQAVTKTALDSLINLDLYSMKLGLSRILETTQKLLPGPIRKTAEMLEKPLKELPLIP